MRARATHDEDALEPKVRTSHERMHFTCFRFTVPQEAVLVTFGDTDILAKIVLEGVIMHPAFVAYRGSLENENKPVGAACDAAVCVLPVIP